MNAHTQTYIHTLTICYYQEIYRNPKVENKSLEKNTRKMLTINYALISVLFCIYTAIQIPRQEAIKMSSYSYHNKTFNSLEGYNYYIFYEPKKEASKEISEKCNKKVINPSSY